MARSTGGAVDRFGINYMATFGDSRGFSEATLPAFNSLFTHGSTGYGGALNLFNHQTTWELANSMSILLAEHFVPAVANRQVWVATYSEIGMYGQSRDTAWIEHIVNDVEGGVYSFELKDKMADEWYDFPLTVKIKVDSSWRDGIRATQNGIAIPFELITEWTYCDDPNKFFEDDGETTYIMVEVVPDRGLVELTRSDTWVLDNSVSGQVTVSIEIDEDCVVIVGLYSVDSSGGLTLVRVEFDEFLEADANKSVTLNLPPEVAEGGTWRIRAFVWNNFEVMMPLYTAFERTL